MAESYATVATPNASKYLKQLCKHFAHKVTAEYHANEGHVEFAPGPCHMVAEDASLSFYCKSEHPQGLAVIQGIIDNHLKRFAWREEVEITWCDGLPENLAPEIGERLSSQF